MKEGTVSDVALAVTAEKNEVCYHRITDYYAGFVLQKYRFDSCW